MAWLKDQAMLDSTTARPVPRFSSCATLFTVLLASCAGNPTVRYTEVTPASEERALRGQLQFALYASWVTLTRAASGAPQDAVAAAGLRQSSPPITSLDGLGGAQALVTPAPSAHQYAVQPGSSPFASTSLDAAYIENTRLLKSIGVEFEDRSVKTIQAVGAAAAAFVPLFEPGPRTPALTLPVVLDVSVPSKWGSWQPVPGPAGAAWAYRVTLPAGPVPLGATPRQAFFDDNAGKSTRLLPVSGCIQAILELSNDPARASRKSFAVTLAHPDYLYTYFLPAKGSIRMHGACGADLTVDATNNSTANAFQALEAVFKQVQAIKAAQDASTK